MKNIIECLYKENDAIGTFDKRKPLYKKWQTILLFFLIVVSGYFAYSEFKHNSSKSFEIFTQLLTNLTFLITVIGLFESNHTSERIGTIQILYSIQENLIDKEFLGRLLSEDKSDAIGKFNRLNLILENLIDFNMNPADTVLLKHIKKYLENYQNNPDIMFQIAEFLFKRDSYIKKATKNTIESTNISRIKEIEKTYADETGKLFLDIVDKIIEEKFDNKN